MKNLQEMECATRTNERIVEIRANPGSGKTQLLVYRCQHLISQGVASKNIQVLSYSTTAVTAMSQRLQRVIPGTRVRVMTVHAFALSTVNKNLELAGLKEPLQLLTVKGRDKLLTQSISRVLSDLRSQASTAKGIARAAAASAHHWLRDHRTAADRRLFAQLFELALASAQQPLEMQGSSTSWFADCGWVAQLVYEQYQALKAVRGSHDFGDFITLAQRVLDRPPAAVQGLEFDHLLVDEYQDISPAIAHLLKSVARHVPNLFVVGDLLTPAEN